MTEHVKILYDFIDWSKIRYSENVPLQGIKKGDRVREGDRALLCCEMQGVLASQKIVLPQQQVRTLQLCKVQYVQSVNKNRLLTLEYELDNASGPSDALVKEPSACRQEDRVLNQHWPRAKSFVHSSLTSQNKIAALLKIQSEPGGKRNACLL